MFAMFPLWPVDADADAADAVRQLTENANLSKATIVGWTTGLVGSFIGLALLARLFQAEGGPGAKYAVVAGIIFPVIVAVSLAANGLRLGVVGLAEKDLAGAVDAYAVADLLGNGMPVFRGIGFLFVALALWKRDSSLVGKALGGGFAVTAILNLLGTGDFVDSGALFFLGLLIMILATISSGVLTLSYKEPS